MTGLSFSKAPSEAHVNVLRGQERGTASAVNWMNLQSHPFAADLIKNEERPRFSGHAQDLPRFKRAWQEYVPTMSLCYPGVPITDALMLRVFKTCLNEGNAIRVGSMMEQNPSLSMAEVWHDLEYRYEEDDNTQERKKWLNIRLVKSGTKPRELTLSDWDRFEAAFNAQKIYVPDRTDEEEFRLVYQQLPHRMS